MAVQRNLQLKKMKRLNKKQQRWAEEVEARRFEREKRMLDEIMEEIPEFPESSSNGTPIWVIFCLKL